MQLKHAITIVHVMVDMRDMYKLYIYILCVCVIWNTDVGRTLQYSTLLPVQTRQPCDNSFENDFICYIYII